MTALTGGVLPHGALALGRPDLVEAGDGLVCLRFETMKVLSALAAVEHLLEAGVVERGDTLVDSSSGIYAHALALACHRHGLRCHIVGSTTVDATLRAQLRILGASLEQMPSSSSLKHDQHRRVARVRELLAEHPRMHWMQQYHDDVHQRGYHRVAAWVHAALGEDPLTVVGPIGTGASSAGLIAGLRAAGHPDVRLTGVQPFGSVTFGAEHVEDPDIIIAGIGSSIPFGNVHHDLFAAVHWLSFEAARAGTVGLLREHAVFAGLSSGAAWLAARHERERDPGRTVLFLAPDTGHRYVEAVFADPDRAWAIDRLRPVEVVDAAGLRLPWCRLPWAHRAAPAAAEHRVDRSVRTPHPRAAERPGGHRVGRAHAPRHDAVRR